MADLVLDLSGPIKELNESAAGARRLNAELRATADVGRGAFQAVVQAAIEAKNKLAAAAAEQRAARDVINEQVAALRQLRQAQNDLNAARKTASSEDVKRITEELKRNATEQRNLKTLIEESRLAYQAEGQAVADVREQIRLNRNEQVLAAAAAKDAAASAATPANSPSVAPVAAVSDAYRAQMDAAAAATAEATRNLEVITRQIAAAQEQVAIEDALRAAYKETRATLALLEAEFESLEADQKKAAPSSDEYRAVTVALRENLKEQVRLTGAAADTVDAGQQHAPALRAAREELLRLVPLEEKAAAAARNAADAEKQVATAAKEAATAVGQTGKTSQDTGNILSGLKGLVAQVFSVIAIKQFISSVIEAGKEADRTLGRLRFVRGSDEGAGQELAFIRATANELGLELNATAEAYSKFIAAAGQGNVPLVEARRTFLAVSDAARSLKLSSADTQGVLLALQQIVSKGTVSAEELRGQIGERLPGAFSIAAKSIGVTEQQLGKMLQQGQLISSDFLPKFTRELEKTFGEGMTAAADSFEANTNRISNEWDRFLLRFESGAGSTLSVISKFSSRANNLLDYLSSAGRSRLGQQEAQQGIKDYAALLDQIVAQTTDAAEKKGLNAGEQIAKALTQQEKTLRSRLALAEADLEAATAEVDNAFVTSYVQKDREQAAARTVSLLKGELGAIEDVREARAKADAESLKQKGRIAELEEKIKRERQELKDLPDGPTYEVERLRRVAELQADEKELARLLGRVEKGAKARENALLAALKALRAEERKLTQQYDKAVLDSLKDQG